MERASTFRAAKSRKTRRARTSPSARARALLVSKLASGLVIVGETTSAVATSFVAIRTDTSGVTDATFGSGGRAAAPVPHGSVANAGAVQGDGRVLVAGDGAGSDGVIARFDSAGHLDATFDADGVLPVAGGKLDAVATTTDGRILYASGGLLHRLAPNGSPDGSFATTSNATLLHGVFVEPDGRTLATGSDVGRPGAVLFRVDGRGVKTDDLAVKFGGGDEQGTSLVVQQSGKIAVSTRSPETLAVLARFNADGTPDPTFGVKGQREFSEVRPDTATVVATSTGRLLAAAGGSVLGFTVDGQPDLAWSTAGKFALAFNEQVRSLVVAPDDTTYLVSSVLAAVKVSKISADGKTGVSKQLSVSGQANAVALQADGRVLVAGTHTVAGPDGMFVVRLDPSTLELDAAFGVVSIKGSTDYEAARALTVMPDGKILVVGASSSVASQIDRPWTGSSRIEVVLLGTDGKIDASFGTNGIASPDIGGNAVALATRVRADGKILVAGRRWNGEKQEAVLVRLTANGQLDTAFGAGGVLVLPIGNESGLNALTLLPDGRALAAGYVNAGIGGEDLALFRFGPE